MKRLRCLHRVLAGHGIDHQERVCRVHCVGNSTHLIHQSAIDREATRSVDDHDISSESTGLVHPASGDEHRITVAALGRFVVGEHRHIDLLTQGAQLVNGRGTLQVSADQQWLTSLRLEVASQLGRVRGFTRTLETSHENDRRWLGGELHFEAFAAKRLSQLVIDGLYDLLAGVDRLRQFDTHAGGANAVGEAPNDLDIDVGLEQRRAHFGQHRRDVGLRQSAPATKFFEDAVKTVRKGVKHRSRG